MIELMMFDYDGVLVDSERLAIRVDVQVLARPGWVMSEQEVIERFVGHSDAARSRARWCRSGKPAGVGKG